MVSDRMYRVEQRLTPEIGSGELGLAICKELVEAHGVVAYGWKVKKTRGLNAVLRYPYIQTRTLLTHQ